MAAYEMRVERMADMICLQESREEREGVGISHPVYDIRKRKRVWTAVRQGRGFPSNALTNLSKKAVGDVNVVDINTRGQKMTWIVNVYDKREGETGERSARRLNWHRILLQGGCRMVLAGDFNTHRQCCNRRCTERRAATYWELIIDEHWLDIGNNDRHAHYWTSHDSTAESVIHLTLANRIFGKWMIVDGCYATGSEHQIIEWELEMEKQEEAGGTQVIRWNIAAMLQEEVEVAEKMWRERVKERANFGAESTWDKVESKAEWCQQALSKVHHATAKKIPICAHSKRWWDGEIKEKRSQLGREKRRRSMLAATAQDKAELQKSVRRRQDKRWKDYPKN